MELISQLKNDAIAKGLCRPWQGKFNESLDMKSLVEMYIKGIDFCISEDYPTLDFLRNHFKGKCEPFGVFIDDEVNLSNAMDTVLNGDSKAMLEYGGFSVSRVFARHNSKVAINAADHAIVTIDAFDNADLVVAISGNADVSVNLYGNANVECMGAVKVRFMQKETY